MPEVQDYQVDAADLRTVEIDCVLTIMANIRGGPSGGELSESEFILLTAVLDFGVAGLSPEARNHWERLKAQHGTRMASGTVARASFEREGG